MQWPEEEDKQWPKNHYTENKLKSSYQIVRGKYLEFKLVQIVSEIYCWEQRPTCLCHVHSVETKLHTKHIRQNKIIKKKSKWTNTHMYWVEINKQEIR
jgi:hypothetical protein